MAAYPCKRVPGDPDLLGICSNPCWVLSAESRVSAATTGRAVLLRGTGCIPICHHPCIAQKVPAAVIALAWKNMNLKRIVLVSGPYLGC